MEIRILQRGDEPLLDRVAPEVFDDPVVPDAAREFLGDPRHHLAVALEDDIIIGFASGVHYLHPDKPHPELWINEVGVAPAYRGRGVGTALVQALLGVARELGCHEAWVLTERDNLPAMRLYTSLGGEQAPQDAVLFAFRLDADSPG
jgi:ribosomal protein S18 acetylase RimI-like enzyme